MSVRAFVSNLIEKVRPMLQQAGDALRNVVFRRRAAYRRVFMDPRGELSPDGRIIIAHLAKMCRATTTKGIVSQGPMGASIDANATLVACGKHEVFQAIMKELHLDLGRVIRAIQDDDALAA